MCVCVCQWEKECKTNSVGHPVRIELTKKDLPAKLFNYYIPSGTLNQHKINQRMLTYIYIYIYIYVALQIISNLVFSFYYQSIIISYIFAIPVMDISILVRRFNFGWVLNFFYCKDCFDRLFLILFSSRF